MKQILKKALATLALVLVFSSVAMAKGSQFRVTRTVRRFI